MLGPVCKVCFSQLGVVGVYLIVRGCIFDFSTSICAVSVLTSLILLHSFLRGVLILLMLF